MNEKHERFCQEYMLDLNATQAAIRTGYSEERAAVTGSELIARDDVQKRISALKKERSQRVSLEADQVIKELAAIAFSNISTFVSIKIIDGAPTLEFSDFSKLSQSDLSAIAQVSQGRYGIRLRMHGKVSALDMLMRHLGLYESDNEQRKESVLEGMTLEQRIKVVQFIQDLRE